MSGIHRGALALARSVAFIVLALAAGCSDDAVNPYRPAVPSGRLEGRVRTGGLPVDAEIIADRVFEDEGSTGNFRTDPDSSGFYSLEVPVGRYQLRLRFSRGGSYYYHEPVPSCGNMPRDTVEVDESRTTPGLDFDLAGLDFRIALSPASNGTYGDLYLERRAEPDSSYLSGYVRSGGGEIRDGQLAVQIPGILPGEYRIRVELSQGGGESFWMPGTRDPAQSPWYRFGVDSLLVVSCQLADQPARIEGRVSGAWLAMGLDEEPYVSLVDADSNQIAHARVAADGSFVIDRYVPCPVKVCVSQNLVDQWAGGPTFEQATVYPLQLGQTISGVEIIQCGVRFNVGGAARPGGPMYFEFYDASGLQLVTTASCQWWSGNYGQIGLPNLWPGLFFVRVARQNLYVGDTEWREQWFDRAADVSQAQLITLGAAGDIAVLDLTLELGGVLSGRVVESESHEWDSYFVVLTPTDAATVCGYSYAAGPNLTFALRGLSDGAFRLGTFPVGQASGPWGPPPSSTVWYPGTSSWEAAGVLEVHDAGVITDLVIPVP